MLHRVQARPLARSPRRSSRVRAERNRRPTRTPRRASVFAGTPGLSRQRTRRAGRRPSTFKTHKQARSRGEGTRRPAGGSLFTRELGAKTAKYLTAPLWIQPVLLKEQNQSCQEVSKLHMQIYARLRNHLVFCGRIYTFGNTTWGVNTKIMPHRRFLFNPMRRLMKHRKIRGGGIWRPRTIKYFRQLPRAARHGLGSRPGCALAPMSFRVPARTRRADARLTERNRPGAGSQA